MFQVTWKDQVACGGTYLVFWYIKGAQQSCTPLMIAVCIKNSEIVLHYSWYRGITYDYEEDTSISKVPIGICVSCCILKKFR